MAEILFGSTTVRLNVSKVWRKVFSQEVFHKTNKERKQYIYRVKAEYNLDEYLRHSIRRMSHGGQRFWDHPVWIIRPKRFPMEAGPNVAPLENLDGAGNEIVADLDRKAIEKQYLEDLEKFKDIFP